MRRAVRSRSWSPARLWRLARTRWDALLATPDGAGRITRGAAAGAFAAMIPAFGLHLCIALGVAFLARGSLAAAAAACLLIGNPLTHAIALPVAYALGRWLLPPVAAPGTGWLPSWARDLLPVVEEALAGGALLGVVAAAAVFVAVRWALSGPRRGRSGAPR
jgi:uncharacterized protein (DUF2062 family)